MRTTFSADHDGFAFANSFTLTGEERERIRSALALTVDAALGALGPLGLAARVAGVRDRLTAIAADAIPERYGLCGGMAFATLDYYYAGRPLPRGGGVDDQPADGSVLRGYLWDRLIESWELNGVTFIEWIARLLLLPEQWPFDGGPVALRDRSREAWRTLQQSLDGGKPVPLGLVGSARDPFLDHQVVATGYEPLDGDRGTIFVYDMNCPGGERTMIVDFSSPILSADETCPRPGNPLRGFFVEHYVARTDVP